MSLFWLQHQASVTGFYQGGGGGPTTTFTQAVAALTPTAHWTLGEASGTAAADQTGTHDGTYENSPTLGVTGWANDSTGATFTRASFEGVAVTDHADLDWGTSDVSYLLAVDMGTPWYTSDIQAFVGKGAGTEYVVGTNTTADRLLVYFDSTSFDLDLTTDLTDGWHLLLITLDRDGNALAYVDGATTAEATASISASSATDVTGANDLFLAKGNTGGAYSFGGSLQHVAYWKGTVITGSQFQTLYAARNGTTGGTGTQADTYAQAVLDLSPVAYYKMDETSGNMVDSSTTGNNGTYQGSPTFGTAGPFTGATGVTFDGSTQWAQAGYSSALDRTASQDFSIVLWMKSSTDNIYKYLVGRTGNGDWDDYELHMAYDQLRSAFGNATESDATTATSSATYALDTGAWRMVAMTADRDGNCTFYVDAVEDGTPAISSYQHELTGTKTLYIGRAAAPGTYFNGSICQVAIFGSALTSGQIGTLWTAAGK